jgi:hypothetical protein
MNTLRDAAVITAAGLAGFAFFGWPVLRGLRVRRWPTAAGKVLESMIEEDESSDSEGDRTRKVTALYAYRVDGKDYESTRLSLISGLVSHKLSSSAQAQLKAFAPGTPVTVHYDPQNHAEAVILTEIPSMYYIAMAVFGLFLLGGVSGLIQVLRS